MYLSIRAAFIRNVAVAGVNGFVTLILLLIAPLGLAAVITNTILVTASTFMICLVGDFVAVWLLRPLNPDRLSQDLRRRDITVLGKTKYIERKRQD